MLLEDKTIILHKISLFLLKILIEGTLKKELQVGEKYLIILCLVKALSSNKKKISF